jgi:hypothetical protein
MFSVPNRLRHLFAQSSFLLEIAPEIIPDFGIYLKPDGDFPQHVQGIMALPPEPPKLPTLKLTPQFQVELRFRSSISRALYDMLTVQVSFFSLETALAQVQEPHPLLLTPTAYANGCTNIILRQDVARIDCLAEGTKKPLRLFMEGKRIGMNLRVITRNGGRILPRYRFRFAVHQHQLS